MSIRGKLMANLHLVVETTAKNCQECATPRGRAPRTSDALWSRLRNEAANLIEQEPLLAGFVTRLLLARVNFSEALCEMLAHKLNTVDLSPEALRGLFSDIISREPDIVEAAQADLRAVYDRDPAATSVAKAFLYMKGFQGLQAHRMAHHLWGMGRRELAFWLQSRVSEVFAMDIHPAAPVGWGVFIDHGTGLVVGETAVIEDDVSILQEVTLGGTGKESGDRHPKVRRGVLIGAGTKILGNIEIGACAKIGAGSVVLKNVPAHTTVVGVPARVVGRHELPNPACCMDHSLPEN